MKVFFVGSDPVGGDVALGSGQVEASLADHLVKMFFERVFDVGVPGGQRVRLGPEIVDVFGASQARGDQEIDFIIFRASVGDAVFAKHLLAQWGRDIANHFFVGYRADIVDGNGARGAGSKGGIRDGGAFDGSD